VFSSKSPQTIENKGRGCEKKLQESLRVRKQKEVKEISEEAKEVRSARVARDGVGSGAADVHWQTHQGRDLRLVTCDW
jgi:microcompartment protein CcmK/EutM